MSNIRKLSSGLIGNLVKIFRKDRCLDEVPFIMLYPQSRIEDVVVTDPADETPKSLLDYAKRDILSAKREVDISMFTIDKGKERELLVDILTELQRREPNVKINIIVNKPSEGKELVDELNRRGVKVNVKSFLKRKVDIIFFRANHSKYIIIDDRLAYVGDQNIQDQPTVGGGYRWFGVTAKVVGKAVKGVKEIFKRSWNKAHIIQLINSPERFALERKDFGKPINVSTLKAYLHDREKLRGVIVAYSEPWSNSVFHRILGKRKRDDLRDLVETAIANAQKEVKMITPNLSSIPVIMAIINALKRGVKVKLILSKNFNDDINLIPNIHNIGDNLRAILFIKYKLLDIPTGRELLSNLEVRWYSNDGREPVVGNESETSHAKYLSVDSKLAVYGSKNQDITSQDICREVNVVELHPARIKRLEEKFFNKVWDRSIPVDLDSLPNIVTYMMKSGMLSIEGFLKRIT